jgi:uncharacterized protein (TIGR04222 family)
VTFLPLSGPQFLALYAGLLLAVVIAAGVLRSNLRGPSGHPGALQLDPYQAAFLAGGFRLAGQAAIAALAARGSLRVDPGGRLAAIEPKPAGLHPVEDAVWTAAPAGPPATRPPRRRERRRRRPATRREAGAPGMTPGQAATYRRIESALRSVAQPVPGAAAPALVAAARPALEQVQDQLRRLGLAMTDAQVESVRALPALVVLTAAVLGGVRLAFGMAAGRPVGDLIGLLIVTVIVALLFFHRPASPGTHRGERLLGDLRRSNAALRASALAAGAVAGADLALAVGLWGPGVLHGGPLDDVGRALQPFGSGGSAGGSGGGSSCSSSSCGGGGSSCGGGGGGGGCGG